VKIFEYLFDDAVGSTTIIDSSGAGNNAQINAVRAGLTPAQLTTEEVPPGYQFKSLKFSVDDMPPSPISGPEPDDQLQFLKVPLTPSIRNIDSTRSFTVSFWAYHSAMPDPLDNPWDGPETMSGKEQFCPQHVCGAEAFYLFVRTKNIATSVPVDERGELAFTGDGPEVVNAGGIAQTALGGVTSDGFHVPINEWVHITGVLAPPDGFPGALPGWPDGVWQIYVNGVLRGELAANTDLADVSQKIFPEAPEIDIRFGNFRGVNRPDPIALGANDYAFNGYLTGIRMYDHAQSAAEICADIATDQRLPQVTLRNPNPGMVLDFGEVIERRTTARAIRLGVRACTSVQIDASLTTGAFSLVDPGPVFSSPGDDPTEESEKLIWVFYRADEFDAAALPDQGMVTITVPDTGDRYAINLRARVIAKPSSSTVLVLDRSGSMNDDAGTAGVRKVDLLRSAATTYVDAMREGDLIGVVRYNSNAPAPFVGLQDVGPDDISIAGRAAAKSFIQGSELNPSGGTSIGDGIFEASALLSPATTDVKAMVVMTDGNENSSRFIADVEPQLTAQTYAVGLGTPANTSAVALDRIVRNTGGYQLITGAPDLDNQLRLHKYFLQILGGVSNSEIVTDPDYIIAKGEKQSHSFMVTEADIDVDVYFISQQPWALRCELIAPNGEVINPARVGIEPNIRFITGRSVHYYRMALPAMIEKPGGHIGEWKAIVSLGSKFNANNEFKSPWPHVRYAFMVQAQSNLTMRALLVQKDFDLQSQMEISVRLKEYDRPVQSGFDVIALITGPDGQATHLRLTALGDGQFSGRFDETSLPGVYTARVIAKGRTLKGTGITREQIVTGSIIKGGGQALPRPNGQGELIDLIREQTECLKKLCKAVERPRPPLTHVPSKVGNFSPAASKALSEAVSTDLIGGKTLSTLDALFNQSDSDKDGD